jgi:hypothetical protein
MSRVGGALAPVTAVLRRYAGRADVKRDEALLKDIREVRGHHDEGGRAGSWV